MKTSANALRWSLEPMLSTTKTAIWTSRFPQVKISQIPAAYGKSKINKSFLEYIKEKVVKKYTAGVSDSNVRALRIIISPTSTYIGFCLN